MWRELLHYEGADDTLAVLPLQRWLRSLEEP